MSSFHNLQNNSVQNARLTSVVRSYVFAVINLLMETLKV